LAPKGDSYKVPHNKIKILVKDAKQMVNGPYYCPKCRKELLKILASKDKKEVYAVCTCGIEQQLTYAPVFQSIDYYNKFVDMVKKKTIVI
jgi:transcription elongation factor Elf1